MEYMYHHHYLHYTGTYSKGMDTFYKGTVITAYI